MIQKDFCYLCKQEKDSMDLKSIIEDEIVPDENGVKSFRTVNHISICNTCYQKEKEASGGSVYDIYAEHFTNKRSK